MAQPEVLVDRDGARVVIIRRWLVGEHALFLFEVLRQNVPWQQMKYSRYGREGDIPRLTFGVGTVNFIDEEGIVERGCDWDVPQILGGCADIPGMEHVRTLCKAIEPLAGHEFNSAYLNYYRNGADSIPAHSDREVSGKHPTVAAVSLGGSREFIFRAKPRDGKPIKTIINNGDLMLMQGRCQELFTHEIPKTEPWAREGTAPRISLTYRYFD